MVDCSAAFAVGQILKLEKKVRYQASGQWQKVSFQDIFCSRSLAFHVALFHTLFPGTFLFDCA